MPRPLLKHHQDQQANSILSATGPQEVHAQQQTNIMELNRLLRKNRSKSYMEAIQKLDSGGPVQNRRQMDEILRVIQDEFPEVCMPDILLGIVAICYLGRPYEVHTLALAGGIIEHYKQGESLPGGLEKARGMAIHGGYAFIEVYTDCCRAVSDSGQVSVVSG